MSIIVVCRKLGDGLFLQTCRDIAQEYKETGITFSDMIVDNASMQLVSRPQQFDVLVMPNLYGSILSNVGAGLVGGPGIIPGANFGREYAVFEPVRAGSNGLKAQYILMLFFSLQGCRHVGSDIGGSNVANPTAMILSSVMMLRHLGLDELANRISNAVFRTIERGHVSYDKFNIYTASNNSLT